MKIWICGSILISVLIASAGCQETGIEKADQPTPRPAELSSSMGESRIPIELKSK